MISSKCCQPQRKPREVDRHRVPIHTIDTALGHQAPGVDQFILIDWDIRTACRWMLQASTSLVASLAARLNEKSAGPCGWVEYLEIEDLLWPCRWS